MALTVYKASAGSGKTFTLAKEFIKLLIKQPHDYKHILAITFTKKATEEMKTRILKNLQELASGEETVMLEALLAELGDDYDAQKIKRRADEAYELIIHNYSRFEVSTIDSFFSRVLKSFARELDLPLSYEVEMNQDLVLNESLENLYRSLDEQPDLLRWLSQFAKSKIDQDKTWNLDDDIKKLGKRLFTEDFQKNFDKAKIPLEELEQVIDQLNKEIKIFEASAKRFVEEAFKVLENNGLVQSDFNYGEGGAFAAFNSILKGDYDITAKKRFIQTLEGTMQWGAKKSPNYEKACEVGEAHLAEIGSAMLHFISNQLPHYLSVSAIVKNIYSFGLLEALYQEVKAYRDEHNILMISDTNKILKDVLEVADAPIMFEKLGSTYKHIMVDEFQDTSSFQWVNLYPLIENALSQGHEVLIVGDVKQSIYRFRGGNMKLLLYQIKQDLKGFYNKETDKNLASNYRSLGHVVTFNNALFDRLPQSLRELELLEESELFELAFHEHQQLVEHDEGGFVEATFFSEEQEWRTKAIDRMITKIRSNEQQGYGFGDMLILVDRNKEIPEMVMRFMDEDIPFVNGESLRLSQSELVVFLIELLHFLRSDKDEVLQLNLIVLYQRLMNRSDQRTYLRAKGERLSLEEAGFPEQFLTEYQSLKQLSLVDLLHQLLLIFDLKEKADIYLQQFMDVVLEQSQKGNHSITTFLDWWEKEGTDETINTAEISNAIRILTIHKAKGLEAPIVFIPFANWSFSPNARLHQFWTSELPEAYQQLSYIPLDFSKSKLLGSFFEQALKQEAEEYALDILNKTYVAFTRPREKLYLTAPQKQRNRGIHEQLFTLLDDMDMQKREEDDGTTVFTGGQEHDKFGQDQKKEELKSLKVYPRSRFLDRLSIRNDSDRFFMLQETDQAKAITLGNQVHDVLADVGVKEDLPMVMRKKLQAGEISATDLHQVQIQIEKLLSSEGVQQWFSDDYEVYNERVLHYNGKELKPDRLLIKGKEAIVIDYKTGEVSGKHVAQVQLYMEASAAMGYQVKGYLLYVEQMKVKEVRL